MHLYMQRRIDRPVLQTAWAFILVFDTLFIQCRVLPKCGVQTRNRVVRKTVMWNPNYKQSCRNGELLLVLRNKISPKAKLKQVQQHIRNSKFKVHLTKLMLLRPWNPVRTVSQISYCVVPYKSVNYTPALSRLETCRNGFESVASDDDDGDDDDYDTLLGSPVNGLKFCSRSCEVELKSLETILEIFNNLSWNRT